MPERAAIDPLEETVRIGGGVWRFDWDASTHTLSIELGGRTYQLHGITWRQKVNLARAVSAGTLPAARGVLRASLGPGGAVPDDEEHREVLTALAEWLTAGSDPLPWDPATLARVTIGVCREAGFAPRDLEALPAADIEDMWKGLAAASPSPETVAAAPPPPALPPFRNDGFNRIIIVPDPPAVVPEGASSASVEADLQVGPGAAGGMLEPLTPPEAPVTRLASPFNRRADIVAIAGPAGFAAAPPVTSAIQRAEVREAPVVVAPAAEGAPLTVQPPAAAPHEQRARTSPAATPTAAPLPPHVSATPPVAPPPGSASAPAPAPVASPLPSRGFASVQRRTVATPAAREQSSADSVSNRTSLPTRYRMVSPSSAPARASRFSPTAPAVSPMPPARAAEPASPVPAPPPIVPVDTLDAAHALPAATGVAMAVVPETLPPSRQAGAPPFDERDLIPFLTTGDDTRRAAPSHTDVVRRFEDDLARAAVEAGVELES